MPKKENGKKVRSSSAQVEMSLPFLVGSTLGLLTAAFAVGYCVRIRCDQLSEPENLMCQWVAEPSLLTFEKYFYDTASTPQNSEATCTSELGESAVHNTCSIQQEQNTFKLNGSRINGHAEFELDSFGEIDLRETLASEVEEEEAMGQHLTIDITGVKADFLQSEHRLLWAVTLLAEEADLKILSHEYHNHARGAVSFHGFLTKSRFSVNAWPKHGVIAMDLFSHGSNNLLPVLDKVKEVFDVGSLQIRWTLKERGYTQTDSEDLAESKAHKNHELLEKIASVQSPFQRVDVYDYIHSRHQSVDAYIRSLDTDKDTYESKNPELFMPDRVVYLDDVMQSRRRGENAYHEALVHPALMGHENPRRVAIIGGGEGATLREVLKHNTIEKVYMVEIDGVMVDVSKTYIPEWSDCSNLMGSEESCYDDPRAELVVTDAIKWFMDRFLHENEIKEEKFDVIILDALDPSGVVAFSDILYGSNDFMRSLYNALNEDGILISQVGEDDDISDPPPEFDDAKYVTTFEKLLKDEGFEYTTFYAEANSGFLAPWSYMLSFKDSASKKRWYANQAEVDLVLHRRGLQTKDSSLSPFQYFDGSSMITYQFTGRVDETLMCRADLAAGCELGHGFNPDTPNTPLATMQQGHAHPVDHTYEALEAAVAGVQIPPLSIDLIRGGPSDGPVKANLLSWIEQLGCTTGFWGGTSVWAPTDGAEIFGSKSGKNDACLEWKTDKSDLSSQPFLERNYMAVLHTLRTRGASNS